MDVRLDNKKKKASLMSSRLTNVPASEGFLISNMKKDKLQFVKSLEPNASSDPQEDK